MSGPGELHDQLDRQGLVREGRLDPELASEAARRWGAGAVVTYLFELAAEQDPGGVGLSRQIVDLILRLDAFEPDVPGLFAVYRRLAEAGPTGAGQHIAWALSRLRMERLVASLEPFLASTDEREREEAASLVATAARLEGDPHGPIFGAGGQAGERRRGIPKVIEDLAVAGNGGGPRRERRMRSMPRPEELAEAEPVGEATAAEPPPEEPAAEEPTAEEAGGEEPTATEAEDRGPRWILAKVIDTTDSEHPTEMEGALRADSPHEVAVMVAGIREGWLAAEGAGPDESVDAKLPGGRAHELTVMFIVPTLSEAQTATIVLPPSGPSNRARFQITAPPAGQRIDASISLLYEGRVLQTAILSGWSFQDPSVVPPGFEMTFRLGVIRPGLADLEHRRAFDAALVTGRSEEARMSVGLRDADTLVAFDEGRLAAVADKVRGLLRGLADDPDSFGGDTAAAGPVGLLRALAYQGRDLYDVIGSKLEAVLAGRELSRIQVVLTDPSDFIPVEFVYDFPTPSQDAALCPNWQSALEDGRCDPKHHPAASRPGTVSKVCPLGFWALKKVIERQVVDAEVADSLEGKDFAIRAEPTAERRRLGDFTAAVVAWSDRVDASVAGQSTAVVATLNEVTGSEAAAVRTWEEWLEAIPARRPSLLVLLSHTVTEQGVTALEIGPDGSGSRVLRVEVGTGYVKSSSADAPVVLLLGCDTAVAKADPQTFVARFRDVGAALVVGTLAPVLGEHAAPVASALVRELRAIAGHRNGAASGEGSTIGDAMLRVRRRLLAKGQLSALCITSFGDADWQLGGSQGGG